MKKELIVDRFEGDFAVCEQPDRTMVNIAKELLPEGVREGDMLHCEKIGGKMMITKNG